MPAPQRRRLASLLHHVRCQPALSASLVSASDASDAGDAPLLTDAQHAQFKEEGFLNAGRIFEDDRISELSSELDRVLAIG